MPQWEPEQDLSEMKGVKAGIAGIKQTANGLKAQEELGHWYYNETPNG
jgi:hypothetical protein